MHLPSHPLQFLEYLRLWETVTAGNSRPVPVLEMHFKVLRGHTSQAEQSVETVHSDF